jgi:hypothetical protein
VLQLNALQKAQYSDGEGDLGGVVNDVFGIHTPIKLGINALTQDWENFQESFASIPANRLLKAGTGGKLGIESKYDKFYRERAMKALVAEGAITEEDAKVAMLTNKGAAWDAIQQRAYGENYGVKEASALFGMRGTPYTEGEQKYNEAQRARETMLTDAVRKFGGNPNMDPEQRYAFLDGKGFYKSDEWTQFKEQNPELEAAQFANEAYGEDGERLPEDEAQNARARSYYLDQIGNAYWNAPELKQKLIAADLGDEFKTLFLDKDTRNLDAVPMKTVLGWANALDQLLQEPVAGAQLPNPDPYKLTFTTDAQNAAYQKFYDEKMAAFGGSDAFYALQDGYYALPEKSEARKQYLIRNPRLKVAWENEDKFYDENPDILKIMERAGLKKIPSAQATSTSDPKGAALNQAVAAAGLNWDTIKRKQAEYKALTSKETKAAYRSKNPDLVRYWELTGAIYNTDAEITQYNGGGSKSDEPYFKYYPKDTYSRTYGQPRGGGKLEIDFQMLKEANERFRPQPKQPYQRGTTYRVGSGTY